MHTDEAVHTAKAGELLETGRYIYDPHEYHGPTIYYAALPFLWAGGARTLADANEWMFRIVPAIFGVGLILLFAGLSGGIGRSEALAAAALAAVSPAMVFYSRYYIQEIPFVFFGAGLIVSGWRYALSRRLAWALCAGVCAGLMAATKETCILAWAAMGGGLAAVALFERPKAALAREWLAGLSWRPIAWAALAAFIVAETIISGFWTNPRGALDLLVTHFHYLNRTAEIRIHDQPWHYYLKMLAYTKYGPGPWWSEGLILGLAAAGGVMAWRRPRDSSPEARLRRFLTAYTVLLAAVYSAIPYKTPWCMLGFLHGMIALAGIGTLGLVRAMPHVALKIAVAVALALSLCQLGAQMHRACFTYDADPRNPYVYGHTSRNLLRLVERCEDIARVAPEGRHLLIKVLTLDSWPLPWYLRAFDRVGYWPGPVDDPDAAIVITSVENQEMVENRLKDQYLPELYGLRPEVLIVAYIRQDLWNAFMKEKMSGP